MMPRRVVFLAFAALLNVAFTVALRVVDKDNNETDTNTLKDTKGDDRTLTRQYGGVPIGGGGFGGAPAGGVGFGGVAPGGGVYGGGPGGGGGAYGGGGGGGGYGGGTGAGGCPLCDSSVYSYCSYKMVHDSCCCDFAGAPQLKPQQCYYFDCQLLYAKTCYEHQLIRNCCCNSPYR